MLSNDDNIKFFDLLKRADASELFAIIQYAGSELNARNEQALIKIREMY